MDINTGQRHRVGHLSDAVPQRELDRCGRCPPPHCCHTRLGRRGWKVVYQLLNVCYLINLETFVESYLHNIYTLFLGSYLTNISTLFPGSFLH